MKANVVLAILAGFAVAYVIGSIIVGCSSPSSPAAQLCCVVRVDDRCIEAQFLASCQEGGAL